MKNTNIELPDGTCMTISGELDSAALAIIQNKLGGRPKGQTFPPPRRANATPATGLATHTEEPLLMPAMKFNLPSGFVHQSAAQASSGETPLEMPRMTFGS